MGEFELDNRYTALQALELWYKCGWKHFCKYYTNNAQRFNLACKARGLVAHDRILLGREVV